MTSFSGYYINVAVCCGARYSTRRYRSVNFMTTAIWTDGYREQSLMPNDHGLRRCNCGNFFLQSELVVISEVEKTDEPLVRCVPPEDLSVAIAQARTPAIELAARLDLWHHLNHAYRVLTDPLFGPTAVKRHGNSDAVEQVGRQRNHGLDVVVVH